MTLPSFLILGAAKAGTTALTRFLRARPDVHLPYKEPNFFSGWGSRLPFADPPGMEPEARQAWGTRADYEALFAGARGAQAVGEASVSSFPAEDAPRLIHELIPRARLVVILRQPVDRAFSHFVMNRQKGTERLRDFPAALAAEGERQARGWHPSSMPWSTSRPSPGRLRIASRPDRTRAPRGRCWPPRTATCAGW